MAAVATQVLTFHVGGAALAARADMVREVFRRARTIRVPNAPESLAGVASLRGAVVPVVSLARLLGEPDPLPGLESPLLLLSLAEPVALRVDAVGALKTLMLDELETAGAARGQVFLQDGDAGRLVDFLALLERDFSTPTQVQVAAATAPAAPAAPAAIAHLSFLTFSLADQTYGLPLDEVAEVLAAPDQVATLPHTDAAMIGVVELRDTVLPVVSLRDVLGLEGAAAPPGRGRIVVARLGPARVGLMVDQLLAILRAPLESLQPVPPILNRGAGEARIEAICRLPDGRGLVSILSAERVFRDETVAQVLAQEPEGEARMTPSGASATHQILVFRLGDEDYGLPIGEVEEVVRLPSRLARAPNTPAFVLGLMSLRGRLVPVIDQASRFGLPESPRGAGRRVIVTTIGELSAGFVVDAVTEILALPEAAFTANPSPTAQAGQLFDRVARVGDDDRLVLIVDPQALLDRAERDLLDQIGPAAAEPGVP